MVGWAKETGNSWAYGRNDLVPEPVTTIAGLGLGVLGSYLANRVEDAQRPLLDAIKQRLRQGGASLPANHDVQNACRIALRQAIELMAQAMDLQIVEPANLLEAIRNRYDSGGNWKPLLDRWHTEEGNWLREFLKEVRSDESLARFDLRPVSTAAKLNRVVRSQPDEAFEDHFQAAMLDWTEHRVQIQNGKQPAFFREWVMEGWPIAPDMPGVRVTLYQAWCLFFQDQLKRDENVFRILTADWLAAIDSRLAAVSFDRGELTDWLGGQLGEQRELLETLRDAVAHLVADVKGISISVGQLIPLVTQFRGEVKDDLSGLREQLGSQFQLLTAVDATTTRTETKVDLVLQRLDDLAAHDDVAIVSPDVPRPAASARIAESRLLDSDGAARLKKLIGREQEKRLLTRAWNDDRVNIVVLVAWGGVGKTALATDWFAGRFNPHWSGVDAFFDWSFYSQGTRDQAAANSDGFLDAALRHFGDVATADSNQPGETKARRLAELVAGQRTLLVLDGVEPLQHPKRLHGEEGRFKDPGVERLLKCLARSPMPGLCVVTTREPVVDLQPFHSTTVREHNLQHLTVKRGAELLHLSGADRAGNSPIGPDDKELLAASREVRGHALTLQLLGGYLRRAHGGDVRRRDRVDFNKAFEQQLEGHAFNVMEAYQRWFEENGTDGERQLAALRLTGFFDRPADGGCLRALRAEPPIAGLTDVLAGLDEEDWNATLEKLEEHRLISIVRDDTSEALGIDAHPLVREYFAGQLRGTGFQPVSTGHHGLEGRATLKTRRGAYLPHWTREGAIYAVTFRLADSLPSAVIETWKRERDEIVLRAKEQGRELSVAESKRLQELFSARVEKHLDAGIGQCWMNRPNVAELVQNALKHFNGERYRLIAWCVMPNHVHVVVQPLPSFALESILHSWKSYTANQVNRMLHRSGAFWQAEYYDHLIRDDADFEHAVEYVLGNPRAAGLSNWPWVGMTDLLPEGGTGFQPVSTGHHGLEGRATDHGLEAHATAWTEGHRRLYEHLCSTTEPRPETLDGLQPLYQAVAHGCLAGMHAEARRDVYRDRILRGTGDDGFYSSRKLGAIGADLGAVACFFERPWTRLSPNLSATAQAWLLNQAALRLRALGRLTEALEPMRATMELNAEKEEWEFAAVCAGNLSELELTLGQVSAAIADAEQSVTFADRSQDAFQRMGKRTTLADALFQAGRGLGFQPKSALPGAGCPSHDLFREAEKMQAARQPEYPRLYSVQGFRYCELLLYGAERAAWHGMLRGTGFQPVADGDHGLEGRATDHGLEGRATDHGLEAHATTLREVTERATQTLEWAEQVRASLLSIALDHLTLGRAGLYRAILSQSQISDLTSDISSHLTAAVDGLRAAGAMEFVARGLLTRSWYLAWTGDAAGAAADLDEAWEIAERGPMPLFQADILLTYARLQISDFKLQIERLDAAFPDPQALLAEARRLIDKHGYHRRDGELEDAEHALQARG